MGLFGLEPTVTLYDLTNTFYEGEAADQPKAQRGHSKEKRSDCPLLTLGLVLDGGGFVQRSRVFAGNVKEHRTLAGMLSALKAPPGARVVMDRGIATEEQVQWLRENGYRYIVVSRERRRRFDAEAAIAHRTRGGHTVHLHKVDDPDGGEVRLYCYSEERRQEGTRHRRALRHALREGPASAARGAVAAAHAKETRPGLAAHRAVEGEKPRRGPALRHRGRRRRERREGRRRDLDPKAHRGLHDHPSGRVLPAQQRDRLERGDAVAHLHHAYRPSRRCSVR